MKGKLLDVAALRRSRYAIEPKSTLTDKELEHLVEQALLCAPTAFNSQSNRVVLLRNENHQLVWSMVLNALKAKVPPQRFEATSEKIASFAMGYATLLFFVDDETVSDLKKQYPSYADKFDAYAEQASGMVQYLLWTALAECGMGASLQHYNPLIDKDVRTQWDLPQSWRLIAQMPMGMPTAPAQAKTHLPIDQMFKAF